MSSQANPQIPQRTFFGQPWGLANLFNIELWERFSFYGMQTLLAFYLYYSAAEGGLGLDSGTAVSLVGAYGGFVFMMSLVASLVSDRILGPQRTLLYSSFLVMAGHIFLAVIPSFIGLGIGLVCIGLGSGGVKTSSQVVLGDFYERSDPRREAGFSIFYLSINIGALIGPVLTGYVWGMSNFHWGFGLAAIGMAVGLVFFLLFRRSTLGDAGFEVPNPLSPQQYRLWALVAVVITVGATLAISTGFIHAEWLSNIMSVIALVASVTLLTQMYRSEITTAAEKSRILGYIPLLIASVIFFAIFQSQFTVLAIYADHRTNLNFFGHKLAPNQISSINPFFIIIFSGIFATMWTRLGDRQWSAPVKFGVANIITGLALLLFLPYAGKGEASTPLLVVTAILFLFTLGELLLSPVGNALATKVAPKAFSSRMMAVWLMTISMGSSISGTLGARYNPNDGAAETTFFITLTVVLVVVGVVLICLKGWVLRKFQDVR
ncbi:peptide MFS transporter [Corynebacterium caspium]|uniref:peptide MFS transporter n=1 Tax=Corynebacterium caspium TaxID=234828 RepID=UPI00035DC70C|nr:oligopeptide:H+ symporter [Corynebacterium caspium]WKD58491.1 Di-/tripeptide transporter [Corynebacterium caspium DSM 44850]